MCYDERNNRAPFLFVLREVHTMKQAIVLVAYGTSDVRQIHSTLEPIYRCMQAAYPQSFVGLAYGSRKIIDKLRAKGQDMPTETQMIESCVQAGYSKILLQPLFITYGQEFRRLQERVEELQASLSSVDLSWGEPLLGKSFKGNGQLLEAILQWLPKPDLGSSDKDGLILVAHGGSPEALAAYDTLQAWLQEVYPYPVYIGTLLDEKGHKILDKVQACHTWAQEKQVDRIHLCPLFLTLGFHPQRDIFGSQEDSYMSVLRKAGYEICPHERALGEVPELVDYLLEQVGPREAIDPAIRNSKKIEIDT